MRAHILEYKIIIEGIAMLTREEQQFDVWSALYDALHGLDDAAEDEHMQAEPLDVYPEEKEHDFKTLFQALHDTPSLRKALEDGSDVSDPTNHINWFCVRQEVIALMHKALDVSMAALDCADQLYTTRNMKKTKATQKKQVEKKAYYARLRGYLDNASVVLSQGRRIPLADFAAVFCNESDYKRVARHAPPGFHQVVASMRSDFTQNDGKELCRIDPVLMRVLFDYGQEKKDRTASVWSKISEGVLFNTKYHVYFPDKSFYPTKIQDAIVEGALTRLDADAQVYFSLDDLFRNKADVTLRRQGVNEVIGQGLFAAEKNIESGVFLHGLSGVLGCGTHQLNPMPTDAHCVHELHLGPLPDGCNLPIELGVLPKEGETAHFYLSGRHVDAGWVMMNNNLSLNTARLYVRFKGSFPLPNWLMDFAAGPIASGKELFTCYSPEHPLWHDKAMHLYPEIITKLKKIREIDIDSRLLSLYPLCRIYLYLTDRIDADDLKNGMLLSGSFRSENIFDSDVCNLFDQVVSGHLVFAWFAFLRDQHPDGFELLKRNKPFVAAFKEAMVSLGEHAGPQPVSSIFDLFEQHFKAEIYDVALGLMRSMVRSKKRLAEQDPRTEKFALAYGKLLDIFDMKFISDKQKILLIGAVCDSKNYEAKDMAAYNEAVFLKTEKLYHQLTQQKKSGVHAMSQADGSGKGSSQLHKKPDSVRSASLRPNPAAAEGFLPVVGNQDGFAGKLKKAAGREQGLFG